MKMTGLAPRRRSWECSHPPHPPMPSNAQIASIAPDVQGRMAPLW